MASITLICLYLATLLPLTIQHQCVGSCNIYLTFNETFNTLPSKCAQTIQNNECYTEISFDYVSKLINIKLGEQSLVGDNATSDNYYILHETEMWHETFNVQWTTFIHKCFYGDLCDFEYVKMKVVEMRKLTWNFEQFQQKLSSALFTSNSGTDAIRCMSTDSQSITCANDIKTCILDADNIYTNKTRRSCSSHSDDQSRKQLGIKEATAYYLNGKIDSQQSLVEYVCNHDLCNGRNPYHNVAQLLIEFNLIRAGTPIEPPFSTSNINEPMYGILLFVFLLLLY